MIWGWFRYGFDTLRRWFREALSMVEEWFWKAPGLLVSNIKICWVDGGDPPGGNDDGTVYAYGQKPH